MIYQFWILFVIVPSLLPQASAAARNKTAETPKEHRNATFSPPKETSYFYRDPKGPGTYEFGYRIEDEVTGNIQYREERRFANGTITGKYGYLRPDGKMTVTSYIADEKGYRKNTKISKNRKPSTISPTTSLPPTTTAIASTTPSTGHPSSTPSAPATNTTTEIPGLNLNKPTLPPPLVEAVMQQYNIDLTPDASPSDILHPNISDIIEGRVPLKTNRNNSQLGFEVVHDFIPKDFPITPFILPTERPSESEDD